MHTDYCHSNSAEDLTTLREKIVAETSGPSGDFILGIIDSLLAGDTVAVTRLGPEINAAEVAGILGTSIRYVVDNQTAINGGLRCSEKEVPSVLELRFQREQVFAFKLAEDERQRKAIRELSRRFQDHN
jgi:hypothetical protein